MYDQCGLFWSPLIAKCQDPEIRIMFRCCSVYIVTVRNDFPRGINKMLVLRMYIRCICIYLKTSLVVSVFSVKMCNILNDKVIVIARRGTLASHSKVRTIDETPLRHTVIQQLSSLVTCSVLYFICLRYISTVYTCVQQILDYCIMLKHFRQGLKYVQF